MSFNPLSYQGNAGLGIGSSGSTPSNMNFTTINNMVRDVMLLDNQRNMEMFQQKVRDRDALTNLILQNQVPAGEIEPAYQGKYDKAKKGVEAAFDKWRGNFNDIEGYKNYIDKVTDLQQTAAHARTNSEQLANLRLQASKETIPWKKKAIMDHIKQQTDQDFWNPVQPYQQLHDMNMDTFKGFVETFKSEVRDPSNLSLIYDTTHLDYQDILRKSRGAFINDLDKANDIQQLYEKFSAYDQRQLVKTLDAMDGQIDKYNSEMGYKQGDPNFVPHIQRAVVNGNTMIKEPMSDFAAKYALTSQEQFTTKTPKFDYKLLQSLAKDKELGLKEKKLKIDAANAQTRRMLVDLKKRELDKADESTKLFSQNWDNISGKIEIPNVGDPAWIAGQEGFNVDATALPEGSQYVQGVDANGKPIRLIPFGAEEVKEKKDGKVIGYKGGHYTATYFVPAGTVIGKTTVTKDTPFTAEELYKAYKDSGFDGSFQDFIQTKFSDKKLDFQLEGQNGKANRVSSFISQMGLSNKLTKKGQVSPFSMNEIELMAQPDEPEESDQSGEPPE